MSCISETCCDAQCVKQLMRSAMYLSSYHDICDIYHQNSMTEINSFDIYSWHKQLTYDTCQEIILPTTWKKSPSGWTTPEIILLNDLKTHQKWGLAFPMPLSWVGRNGCGICYKKRRKQYKHALFTQIAIQLKFLWLINTFPTWCIVNHEMDLLAYVNS